MTQYAQCKLCGEGDLLPFYGEEGTIAYFCTSCRSKFSGYDDDSPQDGRKPFADRASYSLQKTQEEEGPSLFSRYEELFNENPPYKGRGRDEYDPEDADMGGLYWSDIN